MVNQVTLHASKARSAFLQTTAVVFAFSAAGLLLGESSLDVAALVSGGIIAAALYFPFADFSNWNLSFADGAIVGPSGNRWGKVETVSIPIADLDASKLPKTKSPLFSFGDLELVSKTGDTILLAQNFHSNACVEKFISKLRDKLND